MKVRAIAAASPRSSVVGTVELESTPEGLVVTYLTARPVSEGYAPGALLGSSSRLVPWGDLVHIEADEDAVFIETREEPQLKPRMVLVNFSSGHSLNHHELYRRRLIVRVLAACLAVVMAVTLSLAGPRLSERVTALSALAAGGLGAIAILGIGFLTDRWLAFGGVDHTRARTAFLDEVGAYFPRMVRGGADVARRRSRRRPLPPLDSLLPRTTGALVVTLSSLILATLIVGRWVTSHDHADTLASRAAPEAEPPPPEAEAANLEPQIRQTPAQPAEPEPAPQSADELTLGSACTCRRADSVLWRDPIPRLTTLLIDSQRSRDGSHNELTLELAAINNGDEAISELTLRVEFYEQDPPPSLKLYRVADRTLYYAGPLAPAKAIKWSLQARGTHFKVLPPTEGSRQVITGDISPGGDNAAPTNLVAELLDANHRPVRLHGAMMLAYLGDPRARKAATELRRALRENEGTYLERLLRATADARVCEFLSLPSEVRGCVYNASGTKLQDLGIQVRKLASEASHRDPVGPPPQILHAQSWSVPGVLEPGQGRRFSIPIPTQDDAEAAMVEVIVDRQDLLD